MGVVKDKLMTPIPRLDKPWVRPLVYLCIGIACGFAARGGPQEKTVIRWKTKTEIVYKELDNSKYEEKDSWVYKPDGTKEYNRYRLRLSKVSNQGTQNQAVEMEHEQSKTILSVYTFTAGMSVFGESQYFAEGALRLGQTPFWATLGAMVPQNTFKLGDTVFIIGVRYEF